MNSFNYHRLKSGLRLIIVPMRNTKTVTVLVMVGTGSRYETKDINGISHFLEHMMFKGTKKRPGALDISQELDSIGAEYNAFTSKEYTGYYAKAGADKLDILLDVISDIFLNSKLDEVEVAKERGAVIQEINMYLDTPSRYVGDIYEELLYGDTPLGWQVVGKKETISSLRRDQFVDYFNTHYFDRNTVVAVAGNIDSKEIKDKVEKYFKEIRHGEPLLLESIKEYQNEPQAKIFYKKTDQTHFNLGVRAYNMFDDHLEALEVISVILGGGMSSRLFIEVREKRGLAYYVGASADAYKDAGSLIAHTGVDNRRLATAIEVVLDEFKKLKKEKVPEKELKKAKDYIRGKSAIAFESSDALASFYAEQELLKNERLTPEEKLAKIEKVSPEDIRYVANDVFKGERLNLALIGPFKEKNLSIKEILKL